jgi:hypothetical protein
MSENTQFQNISLYIPHIFANFSKEFVEKVFDDLNIGNVKNIDFVSKYGQDGKEYNAAYIHFNEWYDTISARNFQARVVDTGKEARIVYDEPWYWIVLENKARKYIPGERKPRIDLGAAPVISKATPQAVVSTTPAPKKYTPTEAIDLNKAPVKVAIKKPATESMPAPVKLDAEFVSVEVQTSAIVEPVKTELPAEETEEELAWIDALLNEEEEMLDDVEASMEEDNQYLVQIDSRYVQTLEEENQNLQDQIASLQHQLAVVVAQQWNTESSLRTEQVKSQALAEVIQMLKK